MALNRYHQNLSVMGTSYVQVSERVGRISEA